MKKDKAIFIVGILFMLSICGASGWLYFLNTKGTGYSVQRIVEATQTPEPTAIPKADYKNIDIQVLNASKTKGLAKIYADKLIELGFEKLTTGNYADETDKNLLFAPTDFGKEINLEDYEYEKSETIKIIVIE